MREAFLSDWIWLSNEGVVYLPMQKRWFRTDTDFEPGFKFWFALMWQNNYILLFLLFFGLTVAELCYMPWVVSAITEAWHDGIDGGIISSLGSMIPLCGLIFIVGKGFLQFYHDIKTGKTR